MGMQRDVYRQKLYDAERKAFRAMKDDRTRTLDDCRARIYELARTLQAWRAAAGSRADQLINVERASGGTSWANSGGWRIQVARGHTGCDWVLIHEMAHLPTHNSFHCHGTEST